MTDEEVMGTADEQEHLSRLTRDALAIRAGLSASGAKYIIRDDLEKTLDDNGYIKSEDYGLITRLKSPDSIRGKLKLKAGKYENAENMTDYLGAKVVVRNEEEVYKYFEFLKSKYKVLEVSREMYNDPEHVCNMLKADFMINGHRVEVQIQNALDYQVHELEHNIVYKNQKMTFTIGERNMFVKRIRAMVRMAYQGDVEKIRMEPNEKLLNSVVKMVNGYVDKSKEGPSLMSWRGWL